MKKGFTLIELLVVIGIISLLMGILFPALARARRSARIVVVNAELYQIGLALEYYFGDHQKYPPTREDCSDGGLKDHLFRLPPELVRGGYLPVANDRGPVSTVMEDRFNSGHNYKYRSVGETVKDRDIIHKWIKTRLWVPDGFPGRSSLDPDKGRWYDNPKDSPVQWVIFSLGPDFDEERIREIAHNRYPVPRDLWYNSKQNYGFVVRLRLRNGNEFGSFKDY